MMKRTLLALALMLACVSASATLGIKYPCSDNMVLQQKTRALVWGHASPGSSISVSPTWTRQRYSATTDEKGVWRVYVDTPEASYTHYDIVVKGDGGKMTIKDVLIGEVWLASGQSNMEMPIGGWHNSPVEGASEVLTLAPATDHIRMFTVKLHFTDEPIDDVYATDGWLTPGPSTVADMSATAYFFARKLSSALDVPIGIVSFARGGSRVEGWLPRETVESFGTEGYFDMPTDEYHAPSRVYNAMQHPIQGYTAKGFIWYQGCSNVGQSKQFYDRMLILVDQWRKAWNDPDAKMPFYQVEIAPSIYYGGYEEGALLRQAQHDLDKVIPNCATVVTNDLVYDYEPSQIHPCQKQPVGERLAYLALHRDYGFNRLPCYSPEAYEAVSPAPGEVHVRLNNSYNGLEQWEYGEGSGVEVCGADGVFYPAEYIFYEWAGYMRVVCSKVQDPVRVRYGWGDFAPGKIRSHAGLGLVPFSLEVK